MVGWKLVSVEGNQSYTFPSFNLRAGATIYVTSGKDAREDGVSYLKWTTAYIWNNNGDATELFSSIVELISRK